MRHFTVLLTSIFQSLAAQTGTGATILALPKEPIQAQKPVIPLPDYKGKTKII